MEANGIYLCSANSIHDSQRMTEADLLLVVQRNVLPILIFALFDIFVLANVYHPLPSEKSTQTKNSWSKETRLIQSVYRNDPEVIELSFNKIMIFTLSSIYWKGRLSLNSFWWEWKLTIHALLRWASCLNGYGFIRFLFVKSVTVVKQGKYDTYHAIESVYDDSFHHCCHGYSLSCHLNPTSHADRNFFQLYKSIALATSFTFITTIFSMDMNWISNEFDLSSMILTLMIRVEIKYDFDNSYLIVDHI